ncbi:CusA/CzcA family heavy metal efflux RND transporter [Bacteroides uniformis]|uniref:efflux RND transporter permease subunit n=1 Tax=Bacteroides uniformis TaxID=820 RepID=UPI001C37ADF9|nr:efflux RND transporter permease subunit [Bacteroides uniformis]MBV3629023.1 CusA/CzcA family heavy metal efflux RND transporter [Bacteroides uniformis]MBV3640696.1 CusA/CzcA family heavy metal efflux RND transporter [Bacteroides uniformis]MBV3644398.1 CusA/CzcA family heavy metal efflux RND transporter [Bacteroides uniformis]MBV3652891.1 CusA/CzcA family heavy metal efflux RND transporter [Bacteroides uniformis]MBV3688597.1 CusA/CzcA family heavy metal efflux RND transporter [Bacteroides un
MLNKIIGFSLQNRILVLVASVLLLIGGTYTAMHTEVDVFPDLNAPTVVIMTEANGMAAEEVEQLVTFPVETAVNGATGVRRVRSSSTNGFSVVWVEFDWDTDIYLARQIVSEKLAVVSESLPANVGKPTLGPQSSILGEMLIVGLTADSTSMLDLRTIADWTIRPRLLSTGGVAQVAVLGGDIKEYQVQLDPERMRHYGVTLSEVMNITREMNLNANGGVLYEYGNEYIVRGVLSTDKVDQIAKAVVRSNGVSGAPILLEDIADVQIGAKLPKLGTASERGKHAVLLTVTKQPATSTLELTDKLEASLQDLQKNLPADVKVSTDIFRQSRFIESSIGNVQKSLLEGGIFVVIVLFLFLANVRTTVISLVTLPLSLIASILALHYMGFTINTMSLGGMAIAIGSLVDDAIVDVENVYKRLHENRLKPAGEQLPILEVVFNASKEVRMPILNSTLIIIVSFVPLFFLSGMEGRMLVPLGIAFIVALAASTVVALTVTPVLCSYLLGKEKTKKQNNENSDSAVARKMKQWYGSALTFVLGHKKGVLGGIIGLFVVALGCFFTLGRSFLPPFNEGSFTINISSLPGISLEESDKMGHRAEELLLSIPEIQTVARKTGRAELDEHALGVNVSEIEAPFELKDRSRSELVAEVREKLGTIVGANVEIGQPISHRIDAMLSGTKANIAIKLFGDDLNRMFTLGNEIKSAIQGIPSIADLNVEQQIERPQLVISPKREMLAKYGISLPEFSEFVNVCLAGEAVSQVYEKGKSFDLTVRVKDNLRDEMEKIRNLMIDTGDGQKIPLNYVAEIRSAMGPNTISRENVKRKIVISANVADRDLRSVVNDIQAQVDAQIKLPEGYHIEYGGQFESEQAASRTLALTSFMSIVVIFLLLYHEFRSVKESAIILINLPLALIGGVFALLITTGEVSIPAIIGFISLFGIATRNGMLLISHYNHLQQEEGYGVYDSVIRGSLDRLNPILMTALSSALALIPLALSGDLPGNEIQSPMAKVILGGLLTSTFLNGFIIPIVYLMMHHNQQPKTSDNE